MLLSVSGLARFEFPRYTTIDNEEYSIRCDKPLVNNYSL